MPAKAGLSLYFHFPFCLSKCPYCDFYSATAVDLRIDRAEYFCFVARELEILCESDTRLRSSRLVSLYIGGGTPSLAEPTAYRMFLRHLQKHFEIAFPFEWTLEANPGALDFARLGEFADIGINRISLGVQSFCDETLETLGRSHRSAESKTLLQRLFEDSPNGMSWAIDLIFGVPGQTLAQWQSDLDQTITYRPSHCSVYGLTIHPGTPFAKLEAAGKLQLPKDDLQREMMFAARATLRAASYRHYEISNYALPGHESFHNQRYWTGEDYLGLGVAAHSFIGGERWSNPADIQTYCQKLDAGELPRRLETSPTGRAKTGELVMLGLRQLDGIDLSAFQSRFGKDLLVVYSSEIERLTEADVIEIADGRLRLTEEGLLVGDSVMAEFF